MAEKNDYVNRELSWIEFNYRVLSEARDKSHPFCLTSPEIFKHYSF